MIRVLACSILISLLAADAGADEPDFRPDRVLVIYNADWTGDLDGSEPGQDSEELARYYVERRTDPATGRKPWILGLSTGQGADSPLNRVVLPERSGDNGLGLEYTGTDGLVADPWPLATTHGNAAIPISLLSEGRAHPRYAAAWLSRADLAAGPSSRFQVGYVPVNGNPVSLADVRPDGAQKHAAVSVVPRPEGTLVLVDLFALPFRDGRLLFRVEREAADAIDLAIDVAAVRGEPMNPGFAPLAGYVTPVSPPPGESTAFPRLLSMLDLVALSPEGTIHGVLTTKEELDRIVSDTLVVAVADRTNAERGTVLWRAADGQLSPAVNAFRLKDGSLLLAGDLSMKDGGGVEVTWRGRQLDGSPFEKSLVLFDPRDFRISETGPDGVRDDAVYLETIAEPVKRFLESNETDDGIPLRDHVLYIVVTHGLPLQVRSQYGIRRGVLNGRDGDLGSGSSLTQRIQTLYYDLPALGWKPTVVAHSLGGGLGRPRIANPLVSCLTGPGPNPWFHPLAHRGAREKQVFEAGGVEALRQANPPRMTREERAAKGAERFLYGSGRIDGRSIETAKSRIDGAIWAERFLTPELGPSFVSTYQEAPLTAEALKARGFEVREAMGHADRALFCFGLFGYGAGYHEDIGGHAATSVYWEKGFLPGGIAWGIRSFLGWDRAEPVSERAQLFEQILRGGPAVTAGSAGGAHDTNLTWPDSLILTHLLFEGYELGDALLRSSIYLDWTLSVVGDPLYRPDLSRTKPDRSPPAVASREAIRIAAVPSGPGTFALRVEADLGNEEPEMAETRVRVRSVPEEGEPEALEGENPRYLARPRAFVDGLRPETAYDVEVELVDPYGNRFDSGEAFGPLRVVTPAAAEVRTVTERKFLGWKGETTLILYDAGMDDSGEIDVTFVPARAGGFPVFRTREGYTIFDGKGLTIGGAEADVQDPAKALKAGVEYRLLLRWRRFPVTREVYLVAPDGSEHLVASANRLPWNPARRLGTSLTMSGAVEPKAVAIRDDAPAAPAAHRTTLPRKFDREAFLGHGGALAD